MEVTAVLEQMEVKMKSVHKSRKMLRSSIGAMVAMFFAPMVLCAAELTVPESGIFEVTDENNLAENRLDISGDATLKLSVTITDGVAPLKLNLLFTAAAKLTVVAEGCETVRMTGAVRDNSNGASMIFPEGVKSLVMGSASVNMKGLEFPLLQSGVFFSNPQGKLILTNDVTLAVRPSCEWSAANGSRLVLMGKHAIADGDFELTNYDVHIAQSESFANGAKITIPEGRKVIVRPLKFKDDVSGELKGEDHVAITNDIVFAGGLLRHYNNNTIRGLVGTFSGDGNVELCGNGDVTAFNGNFDWNGEINAYNGTSPLIDYTFVTTNAATICPAVKMDHPHQCTCKFMADGQSDGATSVKLTSFSQSNGSPAIMYVRENQTITAGELAGKVDAVADGNGAALVIEKLKANATLNLFPGVALRVESFEAGAKIYLKEDSVGRRDWSVSGPESGDAITLPLIYPEDVTGASLSLGGKLCFSKEERIPVANITILAGADVSACVLDGVQFKNNGGIFTQLVKTWHDKVALWVDATDKSTMTLADVDFPGYKDKIDDDRISEWKDCRSDRQGEGCLRFRLTAFDTDPTKITGETQGGFPKLDAERNLNNITPVRLTRNRGRMQVSTGKGNNTTLTVKYAIFVFNSADGGGNAFFCNKDGALKRVESATVNADDKQKPLVYENPDSRFMFRTNGVDVSSPTETKTTGGWQIISLSDENGVTVNNIGHANNLNTSIGNGGQIYAEILLFAEMPTDEERDAAETYLAKKWSLPLGHEDVTVKHDVNLSALYGNGTIDLASDAVVEFGVFNGTVNLNGNRLQISSLELPFTEATIPSEGRQLWIDPSAKDAVVMGGVESKPSEVAYIHARDNDGIITDPASYCVASPYPQNGNGRRVRIAEGSRSNGDVLPWLEFSNGYDEAAGNHLLIKKGLPGGADKVPTDYTDKSFVDVSVKSGFFVLDTAKGGGTIVSTAANGKTGDFQNRGRGDTASAKIWGSDCSQAVRESDTYLDGTKVDGANSKFSLRPEVFSFNFKPESDASKVKMFGYHGDNGGDSLNQEIMGEWILYSTTQTESVRKGIEAYLMWKWLGKLQNGYSDFRGMTVVGDGVIAAVGPEYLPELLESFTGALEFSRTEWEFTLPKDGGVAAVDAIDLNGREVTLPAMITVKINCKGAANGMYSLIKADALTGVEDVSISADSSLGNKCATLIVTENEISVCIESSGLKMVIR